MFDRNSAFEFLKRVQILVTEVNPKVDGLMNEKWAVFSTESLLCGATYGDGIWFLNPTLDDIVHNYLILFL